MITSHGTDPVRGDQANQDSSWDITNGYVIYVFHVLPSARHLFQLEPNALYLIYLFIDFYPLFHFHVCLLL